MIYQRIILPKYDDWTIDAFYAVSHYEVDDIMECLWEIGIDSANAKEAWDNLSESNVDTGLCYSNYRQHRTVLVVALASSPAELFNSITHEATHACVHIASALGVDFKSETLAYMVGELCRSIYPRIKHLLCECCRNKTQDYD